MIELEGVTKVIHKGVEYEGTFYFNTKTEKISFLIVYGGSLHPLDLDDIPDTWKTRK